MDGRKKSRRLHENTSFYENDFYKGHSRLWIFLFVYLWKSVIPGENNWEMQTEGRIIIIS